MRVLFVCLGNICRSPTAEAVFRTIVSEADLEDRVEIDSCGLIDHHAGNPPDARQSAAAARRGHDLSSIRSRRIEPRDFERFDLVLGMDDDVVASLREQAPAAHLERVMHFLGLDDPGAQREVPDPYYGGPDGFDEVIDLVEEGSRVLLERVRQGLGPA